MTPEDYKQLESLLGKLNLEIGYDKRICIIPNYLHDGYCLEIYSSTGKFQDEYVGATIESLVRKLNHQ